MPWNAPYKEQGARRYEGVGDDQSGREVSSAEAPSGGETIASGEKIGKSGCKVGGGKMRKVPKERVNKSKKGAKPKPGIDGLTFSVSPVKMKKVSLRGKTQMIGTWISDEEDNLEEEEADKIQMRNDRGRDSFAKALYDMVGDDMDDMVSSGSVVVEKENRWLGDSQVKLKNKEQHFIEI